MKRIFITLIGLLFFGVASAQLQKPVTWSYAAKRVNTKEAIVYFKATIDKSWHIYSTMQPEGGPMKTSFSFEPSKDFMLLGKVTEPKPVRKFEKVFDMDVLYFSNSVVFSQRVKVIGKNAVVKGELEFMVCTNSECLPPEEISFSIPIK
ncbi:protein-disulfide reductase DsbD domain-containing protein [Pedobacter insulae]|uniref:Disulphide bond corrector protein DsbC n=1 Tax=Pedobacter insulae TaxID=414048 RepID=A0A1I2VEQ1_9SPHI|nr:protein-disulfide reductase DsbD domain-containing protein [Pedobacter insulae]SFG87825.1 Disulphide bond corrector protein DsbC [Pedobacter insulae]